MNQNPTRKSHANENETIKECELLLDSHQFLLTE